MIDQKSLSTAVFFALSLALPAVAAPLGQAEAPAVLDISPAPQANVEWDSSTHRALPDPGAQPVLAPHTPNLLERSGLNPDVDASANGVGARQRLEFGGQNLIEEQTTIQPYVELGADAEKREDAALLARGGLDADVNAEIGGGTIVNMNDQIDLRLGYTRSEPVGGASLTTEPEDKVESGVNFKF